jgi:hypothetical protein
VGVQAPREMRQSLQRKRHLTIIPEKRRNGVQLGLLLLEEEVRDGHLGHTQHAPPPRVRFVVCCGEDALDVVAIGEADVLLVVLDLLAAEES